MEASDEALDHIVERMYQDGAHMPRASYARDLLNIIVESARYDETDPILTLEAFERAYRLFIPSPEHKPCRPAPS